jgi:hypothetical protein
MRSLSFPIKILDGQPAFADPVAWPQLVGHMEDR